MPSGIIGNGKAHKEISWNDNNVLYLGKSLS